MKYHKAFRGEAERFRMAETPESEGIIDGKGKHFDGVCVFR